MSKTLKNEPAVLVGLLQAALAVAVSFGLDLSAEQVSALLALAAAAGAVFVRQRVVPTAATPSTPSTPATASMPEVEEAVVAG